VGDQFNKNLNILMLINTKLKAHHFYVSDVEGEFMRMTKAQAVNPLMSPAEYRRIHGLV
jgi:hypothetical protein